MFKKLLILWVYLAVIAFIAAFAGTAISEFAFLGHINIARAKAAGVNAITLPALMVGVLSGLYISGNAR